MGIYQLIEKIKRDKNRVDIAKLKNTDTTGDALSGGYIFKKDKFSGSGGAGWTSSRNYFYQYEYPDQDDITSQQKEYIRAFVDSFELALYSPHFADPTAGYRAFADETSFLDFLIMAELTKNVDAYNYSTFFYKDKASNGGKLKIGPVWDFDVAFGGSYFNSRIRFTSKEISPALLEIFNCSGQRIAAIPSNKSTGLHYWDIGSVKINKGFYVARVRCGTALSSIGIIR
jgi:hypothetical protein